jgi:hypothetical protein
MPSDLQMQLPKRNDTRRLLSAAVCIGYAYVHFIASSLCRIDQGLESRIATTYFFDFDTVRNCCTDICENAVFTGKVREQAV